MTGRGRPSHPRSVARRRRWGSGSLVPPATPGATWGIRYHDASGARRSESGFPSRLLAQQALDARRTDIARERIGLPGDASRLPTLAQIADEWFPRRVVSHRAGRKERRVWIRHLAPLLGSLRAPELDLAAVRRYVETKRAELGPATVRGHVRLLSVIYEDMLERPRETGATGSNPCKGLPRSLRQQIRPTHDPRLTPYIEKLVDIRRIYQALPEPIRTGYAVGALAGLRTGEVLALRWDRVDLERRQLVVREAVADGQIGPVKDNEARILPLAPELLAVLRARKLASGGVGLLVPPAHPGRRSGPRRLPARFARSQTLNAALRAVMPPELARAGLDWYRATRHTYASHYVIAGGSLAHLATLLGHSSSEVTLRYAHLRPAALAEADVARIPVDLLAPPATVAPLIGQSTGRRTRQGEQTDDAKPLARKASRGRGGT